MKQIKNILKHSQIHITKPIELHDGDIIDLQELCDEIEAISSVGGTFANSVYVYYKGYNYPQSNHFHYFNSNKLSNYIFNWSASHGRIARIKLSETGLEFEYIKKIDTQILEYEKVSKL